MTEDSPITPEGLPTPMQPDEGTTSVASTTDGVPEEQAATPPGVNLVERLQAVPRTDKNRVGLTLIDLLFGLVIWQVFISTFQTYNYITAAGWAQLSMVAAMIVLSWVGYHNARANAPIWRVNLFTLPFFQYIVDFLIITAYWLLILVNPGIPRLGVSSSGVVTPHYGALSVVPLAGITAIVFILYVVWDTIEIHICESHTYMDHQGSTNLDQPVYADQIANPSKYVMKTVVRRYGRNSSAKYFAVVARPARVFSVIFTVVFFVLFWIMRHYQWTSDASVTAVAIVYTALLVLYRATQVFGSKWLVPGSRP